MSYDELIVWDAISLSSSIIKFADLVAMMYVSSS
jgi:hypothetical protein